MSLSPPQRRCLGEGQGRSRMSPLRTSTLELVDEAVRQDLDQVGKPSNRSGFVQEAVTLAVETARNRCPNGVLPPAPARLNTNPHPRRPCAACAQLRCPDGSELIADRMPMTQDRRPWKRYSHRSSGTPDAAVSTGAVHCRCADSRGGQADVVSARYHHDQPVALAHGVKGIR